jgi:hypothetical protein
MYDYEFGIVRTKQGTVAFVVDLVADGTCRWTTEADWKDVLLVIVVNPAYHFASGKVGRQVTLSKAHKSHMRGVDEAWSIGLDAIMNALYVLEPGWSMWGRVVESSDEGPSAISIEEIAKSVRWIYNNTWESYCEACEV